ncbi:MAG TPA: MarR family transcriptional regulator [Gammaproteobacteria bacterium]|nr:MarR family transcriptional regulator [Gammaproteobacteria bacterium]
MAKDTDLMKAIFMDLRRIMRAMDVYSRQLSNSHGLTGPQMLCLREVSERGSLTTGDLARAIALSPATLTGILDRLEMRGLVSRERRPEDKRRVLVSLTAMGKEMSQELPSPMQERFGSKLAALPAEEQAVIRRALDKMADMMETDIKLPRKKD